MRHLYALCIAISSSILVADAQHIEIGIANGATHFSGDLGNFDGAIQWNGFRPGTAITVRNFLNNPKRYVTRSLDIEGRIAWYRVGYDETAAVADMAGNDLKNYGRGLSFRNDLFGVSGHVVLNAYREPYTPLFQQRFFMFFYTGIGVYYGRPKADLFNGDIALDNRYHFWNDGTIHTVAQNNDAGLVGEIIDKDGKYETDLYEWNTEGAASNGESGKTYGRNTPWHVGVPFGFGIRYMITKQVSIGAEYMYLSFFSDRIDDVSERYATYDEIAERYPDAEMQEIARYISDPTGRGTDGTTSDVFTSPRGNPGLPDAFTYLAFEVSYKFKKKPSRRSFVKL
jgi:hypothetical protein